MTSDNLIRFWEIFSSIKRLLSSSSHESRMKQKNCDAMSRSNTLITKIGWVDFLNGQVHFFASSFHFGRRKITLSGRCWSWRGFLTRITCITGHEQAQPWYKQFLSWILVTINMKQNGRCCLDRSESVCIADDELELANLQLLEANKRISVGLSK